MAATIRKVMAASTVATLGLLVANAWAANPGHITHTTLGCRSEDDLDKFYRMRSDGDQQAIINLVLSGRCRVLEAGTRAFLSKAHWTTAEIRMPGEADDIWVASELFTLDRN